MNHHHSANAVVAKMAVRTVEMNNESAASLIQSVTVHIFQSAPLPRVPVVVQHVANVGHRARDLHRGRITGRLPWGPTAATAKVSVRRQWVPLRSVPRGRDGCGHDAYGNWVCPPY